MGNTASYQADFALIIVGALIFTASFLWKDFFSDVENMYFPKSSGLFYRFLFVVVISFLLVGSAVHLRNVFHVNSSSLQLDDSPLNNQDNQANSVGE